MKKKILYSSILLLIVLCIIFMTNQGTRYTGINYIVVEERVSNFKKITDFYERYRNYKKLIEKINLDKGKDNKVINTATWIYDNIEKISDNETIIDSHTWTIIERRMGVNDQFSDALSVLLVFNNTDSFFRSIFNGKGHPLTFFKHKNYWSLIDPYYGVYFLNKQNQFCKLKNLKNKNCFFFHLKFGEINKNHLGKIFYDKKFNNLKNLEDYYNFLFKDLPKSKEIDDTDIYKRGGRSYVQKPLHRLVYYLQKNIINKP